MVYEPYLRLRRRLTQLFNATQHWRRTAQVLNLSRDATRRLQWFIWHETHGHNAALTCRHFGLHRNTLGRWRARFDPADLRSLESGSTRPHRVRHRQSVSVQDDRVIALRRSHPRWGKLKLAVLYQTTYGELITSWYVQRVIETYRLYPRRRKHKQAHPRAAYVKKRITELTVKQPVTGFLVHLDTIVLHLFGVKRYILTGLDHHSRLAYAWMSPSHASAAARDFLLRLHYLLGRRIENLHTDNGSEFHKHFQEAAARLQLAQYWSRPKTPKDNAALERFNRTLKEEFLREGNFHPDPTVFNPKLTDWLIEYNSVRPHQALGYLTPLAFAERTMGLHTMWSSSTIY